MQEMMGDCVVFIGPDFGNANSNPLFIEDKTIWGSWAKKAEQDGLKIRTGRWNIPGKPCVVLVDFKPYFQQRNELYANAWTDFQVDSLHGYGDYDEANMFSYAAALVVESFYNNNLKNKKEGKKVVYQAHEWMTCLGALYVHKHVPAIATIFTTHATSIGRSIAGNNKPLYEYLWAYNGTQMARELNMEAKHSIERQTAHNVDCFTTVSDVTGRECAELLDRPCDAILMNGFEAGFVPKGLAFGKHRTTARERIFRVANALTGISFSEDTMIVATSGRYEFKNKGIDIFIDSMRKTIDKSNELKRPVLALIQVPGWTSGPRADLQERLAANTIYDSALPMPVITHELHEVDNDRVLGMMRTLGIGNQNGSKVTVIFVPCYLDGRDGIFNMPYYDLLIGNDLAVYPSYYEPWGYTPLEAIAFRVPCVTTSLSGFGLWANKEKGGISHLCDGVEVIDRNDYNFDDVAKGVSHAVLSYAAMDNEETESIRKKAGLLSKKALWKNFITYYQDAYDIALRNTALRNAENSQPEDEDQETEETQQEMQEKPRTTKKGKKKIQNTK